MTKQSALSEAILKNVAREDASTGMAVASLIMAEANRREHLAGGVKSIQWDRERGIGVLVDDLGQAEHLANALSLPKTIRTHKMGPLGTGLGRDGVFAGYRVTVWTVEV